LLIGGALLSVTAVGQTKPGPGTQQVLVVNGSGQPVPTTAQGTTNVAGTVNVGNVPRVTVDNTPNVIIANSPNVAITSMPSVTIAGTPTVTLAPGGSTSVTNPVDGQNNPMPLAVLDAFTIWEDECVINMSNATVGTCNFVTIPTGKRLIIGEFDASGLMDAGVKPLSLGLGTGPAGHVFPVTQMGSAGGFDYFATHQATRLYSPQNAQPQCTLQISAPASHVQYSCQLSGFLVDVQ
jgi:hypothetical protein